MVAIVTKKLQHSRLLTLLDYFPDAGVFVWKESDNPLRRRRSWTLAGQAYGKYLGVTIDGEAHLAHRLVWFYVHGEWPRGQIDHINGNRFDNRISNLRVVDSQTNLQNLRAATSRNACGLLGVSRHGPSWRMQIRYKGRMIAKSGFETPQEAHEAYVEAKRVLHPGCTI